MTIKLPLIFSVVASVFKGRADLVAENLEVRHQVSCLSDRKPRSRLRRIDRVFWVLLSRLWRWKSRKRGVGRPRVSEEVRKLISEMAAMKVGWGAPRIHGELLKLGITISEITVSRYMPKPPPRAGSRWGGFEAFFA